MDDVTLLAAGGNANASFLCVTPLGLGICDGGQDFQL